MRVPLSWLREYVDLPDDVQELAHRLTMSGTNIEAIDSGVASFEGVFIGKVLERVQHPNADRLSLCKVEVGGKEMSIVCGAPNVRAGLTVAVARVGARLLGDLRIRKSKIRGEVSHGMICSARELGLGEEHDGILELDDALESGRDFHEVMPAGEVVLEAEITPNRPDCLALFGIAREVAAVFGASLRTPPVWSGEGLRQAVVPIDIEDPEDCRRYIGRVLRNVEVGPSPDWMRARLRLLGLEPINNIVDITNYVMFETGQPLHAFDLRAVRGGRIVVRRARRGETLRTLDGVDRKLDPQVLVIADAEGPVGLAGIMGGADSMVQETTRDLLLEAAWFRPQVVRAGRRHLLMDTDASYRFERGADIEAARWATDRATRLFVDLAGGEVVEKEFDACPRPYEAVAIELRVARVNALIGSDLDARTVASLLQRLHLPAEADADADRVRVRVPSFRRDLDQEIDLVEEVARIHGYDSIPDDVLPPAPLQPWPHALDATMQRVRDSVIARGYFEIRPSAFMEASDLDRLRLPDDDVRRRTVTLRNPLVRACNTMRTTLVPGALRVLRHNLHHGRETVRVMQLDRVFHDVPGEIAGLPTEAERLLLAACGSVRPPSWDEPPRAVDLYDLKGDVELLLEDLGVDTVWTWGYTEPFLEETTSFLVSTGYGEVGRGGRVRNDVVEAFDVEAPVYLVDLDLAALQKGVRQRATFEELPRFPAVKRDLSLVVPHPVTYAEVEDVVRRASGAILESVSCFDLFQENDGHPRSLGLRLRFRSPERTLTDELVEPLIQKILRKLEGSLQVTLRVV